MTTDHPHPEHTPPDAADVVSSGPASNRVDRELSTMLDAIGALERGRTPDGLAARAASASAEAVVRRSEPRTLAFEQKPVAPKRWALPAAFGGLVLAAAVAVIATVGLGWFGSSPQRPHTLGDEQDETIAYVDDELGEWLDALEGAGDAWDLAVGSASVEDSGLLATDLWSIDDTFLTEDVVF